MTRSGYTCGRCLQVLHGARSKVRGSPIQLQRFAGFTTTTAVRGFGTQRQRGNGAIGQGQSQRASSSSTSRSRVEQSESIHDSAPPPSTDSHRVLLKPNNLFHPFSKSPSPDIRRRAAFMRQNAFCAHPSHQRTRIASSVHDPEARKPEGPTEAAAALPPAHVHFECPDCGIPVYCSEDHWVDDFEAHLEVCDTLKQINEDDHDLHSGRFFPEFSYPGPQDDNYIVNMTNWDTYLYTREFDAINSDRSMRQVTRMLTYPLTVGSVLHELSPYGIGRSGRLTLEGLKSMSGKCRILSHMKHTHICH